MSSDSSTEDNYGARVSNALSQHEKEVWNVISGLDERMVALGAENLALTAQLSAEAEVAESGRPGRAELLAKKGSIVGGVGCPPNCRTSGKPRGSLGEAPTF